MTAHWGSFMHALDSHARRVELVLQAEVAECGLACLAMVASYHGLQADLPAMRARFSVSNKGMTLAQLAAHARDLGLIPHGVRLELDELRDLKTPAVLHWNMNHFVVLVRVSRRAIVIHDPALGRRQLSYREASDAFTGQALQFSRGADFAPRDERRAVSIKTLIGTIDGLWKSLRIGIVLALALEVLAILTPMINQWIVDDTLVAGDRDQLHVLAAGMLLMLVVQTALQQARSWTLARLSTDMRLQWSRNVFAHMMRLPLRWFEARHLGDIVSRFGSVTTIQQTITSGFLTVTLDGMFAIAALVAMFAYSAALATVVLGSVAAYGALRAAAYQPLRRASLEAVALAAKEQSHFLESLRAVQAIKLFGREFDRMSRWTALSIDAINRQLRAQRVQLWFDNLHAGVSGLATVMVFWLASDLIIDGRFTIGMLMAFSSYSGQFTGRVGGLVDNIISWKMLGMHAERVADIALERAEPDGEGNGVEHLAPRIELAGVGFRYGHDQPWILHDLTFSIEPGESVAITGPSGCGKTTLLKLLLGILEPTEGEVLYGGVPLRRLGIGAYRKVLGVVMQDDALLAGSIRENIAFFDTPDDFDRVQRCARLAALHGDIQGMPMAYNTHCGDLGAALSGGQKQRILLARALYRNPRVLLLDEATSHLDLDTERRVNAAIAGLQVTRILVAHRPETIASADRVITLQAPRVVRPASLHQVSGPA